MVRVILSPCAKEKEKAAQTRDNCIIAGLGRSSRGITATFLFSPQSLSLLLLLLLLLLTFFSVCLSAKFREGDMYIDACGSGYRFSLLFNYSPGEISGETGFLATARAHSCGRRVLAVRGSRCENCRSIYTFIYIIGKRQSRRGGAYWFPFVFPGLCTVHVSFFSCRFAESHVDC